MTEDKEHITISVGDDRSGFKDNDAFTLSVDGLDINQTSKDVEAIQLHSVALGTSDSGSEKFQAKDDDGDGAPNLRRDRPHSASQISRRTASSTKSRASLSPSIIMTNYSSSNMFSYRDGVLDQSLAECKKSALQAEIDGELKMWWLLTEIDHWDLERERIVLLAEKSLLIIKFDFIRISVAEVRRIALNQIEKLMIGDIVYPPSSFMPPRNHGGLRIFVSKEEPSIIQRWNPWCQSLPYVTLTHHLLIYNQTECETATFNVEDLAESLVTAVNLAVNGGVIDEAQCKKINLVEDTIMIETYASVSSMIYNQSKLGFNLDRGGVNF